MIKLRSLNIPALESIQVIGLFLGLIGIIISALAIFDPLWLVNLANQEWDKSYISLWLFPLGIHAIGLAFLATSIHLLIRELWLGILAFVLTAAALCCFAAGTFYPFAILGFLGCVAVMWEIEKVHLHG